jgi:23S rRNA (pseudouridine1915-N3)-methyltransferase
MNIKIVTTKKMDMNFIKKGIKEYSKRLNRFCSIEDVYIKKSEDIKKYIRDKTYIIQLNNKGSLISSEELSLHLNDLGLKGKSDIVFFVDQEEILSVEVHMNIALSSVDMDYELMVLTLYEQIYRAFTIINKLTYHK